MKMFVDFVKFSVLFIVELIMFLGVIRYGPSLAGFTPFQKTLAFTFLGIVILVILQVYHSGFHNFLSGIKGVKEETKRKVSALTWAWRITGSVIVLAGFFLMVGGITEQFAIDSVIGKIVTAVGVMILIFKSRLGNPKA